MAESTVGQHIVKQTAERLKQEDFIAAASVKENHVGPYVEVCVPDQVAMSKMYEQIDQYPCYIDVIEPT